MGRKKMDLNIEALKAVAPENQAAFADAVAVTDIANVSTCVVSETKIFDSAQFNIANQAKAGMAQHINLASRIVGMDNINHLKGELGDIAAQLNSVRLPDTQVNLDGRNTDISWALKQHGNDTNQAVYNRIMAVMLGKERMSEVRKHCTKANMWSKPALWLNQMLGAECSKSYVGLIHQDYPDLEPMATDLQHVTDEHLKVLLGSILFSQVEYIAKTNRIAPFQAFIVMVDCMLKLFKYRSQPITSISIWDDVTDDANDAPRQVLTADAAMKMRA